MQVVKAPDAATWLQQAGRLLLADEARHNLVLGLAGTLRDRPELYPEHELWLVEDDGAVVGAALRTPPYRLVLARPTVPGALEALAAGLPDVPGVVAAVPEGHEFAAAWQARTGTEIRPGHAQGVYKLERVVPARPASGSSRAATDADRGLLLEWLHAFSIEALHEESPTWSTSSAWSPSASAPRPTRASCSGRTGRAGLGDGVRQPDSERLPDRPGLHAAGAARPRLRERARGGGLAGAARRGQALLLPLHRPRQPDLEQDLRRPRLRARLRLRGARLRQRASS